MTTKQNQPPSSTLHGTELLNSSLDSGPKSCIFTEVIRLRQDLIGFKSDQDIQSLSHQLNKIIETYKSVAKEHSQGHKRRSITESVVRWIHHNNKIEFAGFEELHDTRTCIQSFKSLHEEHKGKVKDVVNTLQLLRSTYTPDPTLPSLVFSVNSLKDWHKILFQDIKGLDFVGEIRNKGSCTKKEDGNFLIYTQNS
ncbi:hypothetical protein PROFUN_11904 [Planoprotostelium fungivorum]|uniref:Uncharacterized protein n=1 Tax=Planoprotostelium fungivorum TaxID=1890364 RepID=A0A2P6N926_9EUKA|nr:hypothetical protein PROFUN_16805 [Planoprotostelium fungivorum]PRP80449.1 hypothetical protein PROFUN_11904 [Planoprotostelium fungivorum]